MDFTMADRKPLDPAPYIEMSGNNTVTHRVPHDFSYGFGRVRFAPREGFDDDPTNYPDHISVNASKIARP